MTLSCFREDGEKVQTKSCKLQSAELMRKADNEREARLKQKPGARSKTQAHGHKGELSQRCTVPVRREKGAEASRLPAACWLVFPPALRRARRETPDIPDPDGLSPLTFLHPPPKKLTKRKESSGERKPE